jgi:hypothetical protein
MSLSFASFIALTWPTHTDARTRAGITGDKGLTVVVR